MWDYLRLNMIEVCEWYPLNEPLRYLGKFSSFAETFNAYAPIVHPPD